VSEAEVASEWIELADAAYAVHQSVWSYGENNEFPDGLRELPILDERLSAALANVLFQPGGSRMTVRLPDAARDGYTIVWDVADGDEDKTVTVYATGEEGDVHNKRPQPNTGRAGLFYPAGFSGSSDVEIKDEDGNVLDSGTISV